MIALTGLHILMFALAGGTNNSMRANSRPLRCGYNVGTSKTMPRAQKNNERHETQSMMSCYSDDLLKKYFLLPNNSMFFGIICAFTSYVASLSIVLTDFCFRKQSPLRPNKVFVCETGTNGSRN